MTHKQGKIRLIRKTSQTFLWVSSVLIVVSTMVLYFYLQNLLEQEVEEELFSTEARIVTSLTSNRLTYDMPPVVEISTVAKLGLAKLKDTVIYDPSQNEMEEFRELTSYKAIHGKNYKITVRSLILESEYILIAVLISYIIIILLVFLFLFYVNKSRNQRIWQPFFTNLERMKQFSVTSKQPINLVDSEILEFHELNCEIATLTNKVKTDYQNLKQFTENVSHELQTPLAIIQAKIENLMNAEHLKDAQFDQLTSIQKDIQRLTQMNKRLTLLTKIENNQFKNIAEVALAALMEKTIQNFHEISAVEIKYLKKDEILTKMDPYLAEVLCTNLISNAIKHNSKEGYIEVLTRDNLLTISNHGSKALKHPEQLYTRFYRESEAQKSTGLGLAIVKRICDLYNFKMEYEFTNGMHIFSVNLR